MVANILTKEKLYTIDEYFEIVEKTNQRNEFQNGKIITMPGGSFAHNKIIGNIYTQSDFLLGEAFDIIHSEQAIYLSEYNHIVYADNCIIEGKPEMYQSGKRAIMNPVVIFEVASKSTEKYDRFSKFEKYKTIPSFKEYVLVDQEMPIVEVFLLKDEIWQRNIYIGLDEIVRLNAVDIEIKMTAIYRKVKNLLDPQTMLDL